MVESTALEMRHRGDSIEGSNPSLSAKALNKASFLNIFNACSFSVACQQILYILTPSFVSMLFFSKFFWISGTLLKNKRNFEEFGQVDRIVLQFNLVDKHE